MKHHIVRQDCFEHILVYQTEGNKELVPASSFPTSSSSQVEPYQVSVYDIQQLLSKNQNIVKNAFSYEMTVKKKGQREGIIAQLNFIRDEEKDQNMGSKIEILGLTMFIHLILPRDFTICLFIQEIRLSQPLYLL